MINSHSRTHRMEWTNELELSFLESYQEESVLWDPKHHFHKDKKRVNDAWLRISKLFNISVPELKKKKDSLMATFRGHIRKVKASQQSGASIDELYQPVWFAFPYMQSFLADRYECNQTIVTENNYDEEEEEEESIPDNFKGKVRGASKGPTARTLPRLQQVFRRRKSPIKLQDAGKSMKDALTTLNRALSQNSPQEDDCDLFGKMLAKKLRKIPDRERMQLMYEIDGIFIRRISNGSSTAFVSPFNATSVPCPDQSSSPFTYSEPVTQQEINSDQNESSPDCKTFL